MVRIGFPRRPDTQQSALEDALCRANIFIALEEEKTAMAKRHTPTKTQAPKEKPKEEHYEPRQHYDRSYRKNEAERRATNCYVQAKPAGPIMVRTPPVEQIRPPGRPKIGPRRRIFAVLLRLPQAPWPRYSAMPTLAGVPPRQIHQRGDIGIRSSLFSKEPESSASERPRRSVGTPDQEIPARRTQSRQRKRRSTETEPRGNERLPVATIPARRRINMIMGGLPTCNDSVRSIKDYGRKTSMAQQWKQDVGAELDEASIISLKDSDANGLHTSHNDPLVMELMIGDCEVTRVLINTGSTVDLIFKETLQKMELQDCRIKPKKKPLTGFSGDTTMTVGTIKLDGTSRTGHQDRQVRGVDKPAIYNAIMGTPGSTH
ncbi:unnamed protein product [Microthlaspi erraticum]|uniref:Uncharacterized protein n=1 Tax=Microthlaspi erraticum TaxID=1685480 RepID=A0A6D2KVJ4_9BRAS|nr:unnamed protein product [Microthlaspi erraticum]